MLKRSFAVFTACLFLSGCGFTTTMPEETAPAVSDKVNKNEVTGTVTSVTDGDTFVVKLAEAYVLRGMPLSKGQEIAIRLLLVDTPESVGDKAGMPYGEEASTFTKELLKGKTVTLEFDDGEIQDHYDRFLAYAYVDGKRVQDTLIENGYAMIRYIDAPNTRHLDELRSLEEKAREKGEAIWSIPDYIHIEEGFNEAASTDAYQKISSTIEQKTKDAAKEVIDGAVDSLFDSLKPE